MKTSRLWLISGIVAVAAVIIAIAAAIASASLPSEPEPSASPTVTETTAPTPEPSATPSPTASGSAFSPDCDNTATPGFLASMQSQGWTALDTSREGAGARPFDGFLDGMPEITVVCRWAADPAAATDNVVDLAWTILPAEAIADFVQRTTEAGAVLSEAPEGSYLEVAGGGAYLFTESDSRWSTTKANLANIKAPHEE